MAAFCLLSLRGCEIICLHSSPPPPVDLGAPHRRSSPAKSDHREERPHYFFIVFVRLRLSSQAGVEPIQFPTLVRLIEERNSFVWREESSILGLNEQVSGGGGE